MARYTENEILIDVPVNDVWEALTDKDITVLYMYGCEINTDWKIGSPLTWVGKEDKVQYVTGILKAYEKNKVFSYTTFDPAGEYPDIPENHLTVTYTLENVKNKSTLLKVTQGDFDIVANGKKRYEDSTKDGGWDPLLLSLKTLLESVDES